METPVMSKRQTLLLKLAEILDFPHQKLTPETELASTEMWDSMATVMVVAAIDDVCGTTADGIAVSECKTVSDVLLLAGLGEEQTITPGDVAKLGDVLR